MYCIALHFFGTVLTASEFVSQGTVLKTVVHLHFREWPDHGCPPSTDLLIDFCNSIRNILSKCENGLALVHCRYTVPIISKSMSAQIIFLAPALVEQEH